LPTVKAFWFQLKEERREAGKREGRAGGKKTLQGCYNAFLPPVMASFLLEICLFLGSLYIFFQHF
jgi:hypothetical protein